MMLVKKQFVYFVMHFFSTAVKINSLKKDSFSLTRRKFDFQLKKEWENKCTPKIKLLNCGANPSDMPKYSPYVNYIILSDIKVDNSCVILQDISLTWEVWLVSNDENHSELKQELVFIDKQSYVVEEGSLYYGVYKIKLKTNAIFSNYILSKNSFCYFEMVSLPVQTVIVGGSKRQIYYKNPIHFEVLPLVAPDVCEPKQGIGNMPPQKIIYEWKCDSDDDFCALFKTVKSSREIVGNFSPLKVYNFSLNVQVIKNEAKLQKKQSEFQALLMGTTNELELSIECMVNCGGSIFKSNPQDIIHLEAKLKGYKGNLKNIIFHWDYSFEDSEEKVEDIMAIREKGTAGNSLVVKQNKLMEGRNYTFAVSVQNLYSAELIVRTCKLPIKPNCTMFPEGGVRGETFFKINCLTHEHRENFLSLTFEFFDRYSNESLGRFLGASSTGTLDRVVLTRDKLFVRVFNIFGAYIETFIEVKLSPFIQSMSIENHLPHNQMLGQYIYRIGLISAYGDYLNSNNFSPNITIVLLTMLTAEADFVEEITGATLLVNALHNIFCNTSNKIQHLTSDIVKNVGKIMHHVSEILKNTMTDPFKSSRYTATPRVLDISNYILICSSELLDRYDYDYNVVDSKVHHDLKVSAFYIMESLNNVFTAVAFKVLMFKGFRSLKSKFINIMLEYIGTNSKRLSLSSNLTETLGKSTGVCSKNFPEYYAQAINFVKLPFWWKTNLLGEINTNVVVLQFKHGKDKVPEDEITEASYTFGLDVNDFEPSLIFGSVQQPNPKNSSDINDFIVAVHRIAPPVNSKTFVKFFGIEGNLTLRAILLQDQRPDYDYMSFQSMIITNKSSSLNLSMIESNNQLFIYLGIIPGVEVKTGETINYTFNLFTASCKVRRYLSWMTGSKCKVSDETNKMLVVCKCSLPTITLGGQIFVPKHEKNPFSDIPLMISVSQNPFPIILIIVIMLLYIFLLLWTIRKDKKNKKKVNLIVLEDNDVRDTCGYLVGVFTGSRIRAGTTSKVTIMLLGEEGMSESHTLKSRFRPTLQSNCDDWFLLFTHHHLGSLTKIIIWIDYFGPRPHWYCSKIFVCDLQKYDTDTFIIEKWFGINIQEIHLKTVQECATYKEINNKFRLISENLENGFRENHLWLSLFFRHPRSLVNSSQRLAVVFCSLFVTIGTSVLVYFLKSPNLEDLASYSISKEMLVSGIVSGLVGSLFYFITLNFFKSSYKVVSPPAGYHTHDDGATMYHLERQYSIMVEDPVWLKKLKNISRYIKPCRVIPVQKEGDNFSGAKLNGRKLFFSFFLCVAISVLSIHLTIICGMRFGDIKSYTWFTSVIIAIIQTACIIFPLKIIATSLIFAVSQKRYFPLMSHTIQFSKKVGGITRRTFEDYNENSIVGTNLNTKPSLHSAIKQELKKKQTRIRVMWTSLYISGCLVFLGIVCWLILGFYLNEFCIINHTVCNEIDTEESCQTSEYTNIKNYREFLGTIQNRMLPVLYSTKWYNGENKTLPIESFPSSGWLGNEMSRVIGPPRLRQIRVKKVFDCNAPKFMLMNCSGSFTPLSKYTQDTSQYSTGWVIEDWVDCQFDQTSWHFQDAEKTMGIDVRTRSGFVYHGGGYISSLGGTEDDAKLAISNIIDTNWVDKYTRLLILEFTTYNVNQDVFTSVMVFAEATPFGSVKIFNKIYSMKLSVFPASGVVFLGYFFIFVVRVIVLMNIMGIGPFFKNLWNLQEIIILISYFVCVIYYGTFLVQSKSYRENVDKQGKDIFFQVQKLTAETLKLTDTVSVLFCLVAFRMLRIIRFNADVRQYLHDLSSAIKGIIWIWVVLSLYIFIHWRFIMFLVAPPPGDSIKDILVYQADFRTVVNQYNNSHSKLLAFILSLLTQIGIFSYVCSLTHYYRQGQLQRNPTTYRESIVNNQKKNLLKSRLWESWFD